MRDLFTPLTRDERQEESVKKWIEANGRGCIVACTGYGKTRVAINCIDKLRTKYPNLTILVVVPTDTLYRQWTTIIDERGLGINIEVQIINTAAKREHTCDLLIIDEIHRCGADSFREVFNKVKYKLILGLTATIERLDGKHEIIEKHCPVIDSIPIEVAKLNNWVSNFIEYQVIITAKDLKNYQQYNKEFTEHFEFFNFDFALLQSMLGSQGFVARARYRDEICRDVSKRTEVFKAVTYHATAAMRALQARKKFIYNHEQKLEVAKKIIAARSDRKIITFSANVKMAESLGIGYVYTGKEGKKKNRITVEEFSKLSSGVLNSCQLANEGFDCAGLSVGIVMGLDSSAIKSTQRTGRVIRKEGDKFAEMFTLVLEDTVECDWYKKSHSAVEYVTIDVENLEKLLNGEPWEPYKKKLQNFTYRF